MIIYSAFMCGIFQLLNLKDNLDCFQKGFENGKHRGPDHSIMSTNNELRFIQGFHRLAINGLNAKSNQPIEISGVEVICNGQIYNHKQLKKEFQWNSETDSDCEAIIHVYIRFGIKGLLHLLDGVFAFVLLDKRDIDNVKMFIARDPFGVRPLYRMEFLDSDFTLSYAFSSEVKMLTPIAEKYIVKNIDHFAPGTYEVFYLKNKIWKSYNQSHYFYTLHSNCIKINEFDMVKKLVRDSLVNAVKKRVDNTDREIACLLSGGLDSSLIASIVQSVSSVPIRTYSIGLKNSEDLKYANKVAAHINSIHTDIIIEESEFLKAIPEVIYAIESYDTTTVRASVGNYLVAKYISEHSHAKVIFNGDGSDEVCGGYLYFHESPNAYEFDEECRRLLSDIHKFDVLRSDRSISHHGLEARTPFLDKNFVQLYMGLLSTFKFMGLKNNKDHDKVCEKYVLRESFADTNILPDSVLWRKKEAFSDGVSSQDRSWYEIIQEHVNSMDIPSIDTNHNVPETKEQTYYRSIFNQYFGKSFEKIIPYFWMPKFVHATDASARTLNIYNDKNNQNQT